MVKNVDHFKIAMLVVVVSVFLFSVAFFTENGATAFVVSEKKDVQNPPLTVDLGSLGELGSGNYYIDYEGVIYWLDDSSRPAIAKLSDPGHNAGRQFYVSREGVVSFI